MASVGRASRSKRGGRPAQGADAGRVVLWGVLMDGSLGNFLFPDSATAEREARRLREEHPASTLEWAQVGVQLLMRRPLRPKIGRMQRVPDGLEAPGP